ncbi:hypothetical protein KSP35_13120 [Aquihabitans sp. G128]|uniref:hypothetical protein n=1 Tax=Aquihabitans sp. G128 TaxID=2849779 RepID=UPI001C23397E|nr:hypothetical protein [Aquihabitans sp. G128]QXC59344.1 hypothetical protein KSP35_13120 [Aquihabitans sp. G128]
MPRPAPSLSRQVKGLPRYYMDCGWYRHPRFAGLTPDALFVFEAAVGYCTEHATDGTMPGHHEDLAAALGLRASAVKKALTPLLDRGALSRTDSGEIAIRNWAEHNPTTAEVEAYNEAKSRSGALGNHTRWHVARGVTDPECDLCAAPNSDRKCDPEPSQEGSHGMGWDGSSSSSPPRATDRTPPDVAGAGAPTEEDQPPNPQTTAEAAIAHMAACDLARARADGVPIRTEAPYLAKLTESRRIENLDRLTELARQSPTASPVDLAERLDPTCGPLDGGAARADAAWHADKAHLDAEAADAEAQRAQRTAALELLGREPQLEADLTAKARAEHPDAKPVVIRQHVIHLAIAHLEDPAA